MGPKPGPEPAMKTTLSISLFGKVSVQLGDEALLVHTPPKAKELLAYLTLHRGKAHPRDTLAELLWSDLDTPNSRKYLRQALWQLHSGLLSLGRTRFAQLLHAESDWIELKLDSRVEVDVARFERAFSLGNATRGEDLPSDVARSLAEAARLHRGELLEGWVAQWCCYDRERFRRMYLSILDKLADYYESRHEYETAMAYVTLSLSTDPAREQSHRCLMRALAMSGDRSGAIRQYSRCVEAVRDELGVEPEPETVVLERMIRAGEIVGMVRERFTGTNGAPSSRGGDLTVVTGSRRAASSRPRSVG